MSQAPITLPLQPTTDDLAHFDVSGAHKSAKHLLDPADPIRQRIIIERAVVRRAVSDLLAKGYALRVNYGGDEGYGCERTTDLATIMCAIQACDEELLNVYAPIPEAGWRMVSTIYLVYGNDGWDVIADHGMSIADDLAGASELADAIADAIPLTPSQQAHVDFINSQRARA